MKATKIIASRSRDQSKMLGTLIGTLSNFWAWIFLLVLVAFFSLSGPGFFDIFNFQSIGANMSLVLIMALGQTFVIIAGGIDLSTGYVMGLSSVAASVAMTHLSPGTALEVVVAAGEYARVLSGRLPWSFSD